MMQLAKQEQLAKFKLFLKTSIFKPRSHLKCGNHSSLNSKCHHHSILLITEVATGGVLWKKLFLKISQNSQENTYTRVSFLIKLQAPFATLLKKRPWHSFIKKETLAQVFSCEFWEIFKGTFFTEHLRRTASVDLLFKKFSRSHSLCDITNLPYNQK